MTNLEQLPDRMSAVESQIVQFRVEVREEFSAVRQEIADVRQEVSDLRQEVVDLRHWVAEQDDETRRYMRVLHEEVIERLATIQEGQAARRRPPGKSR